MVNKYKIVKLNENEYSFDTDLGLSYSIELKKSKAFYHTENNDVKNNERGFRPRCFS